MPKVSSLNPQHLNAQVGNVYLAQPADAEFMLELVDRLPGLERDIAQLRRTPQDRRLLAELVLALDEFANQAELCDFELGRRLLQPMVQLLDRVQATELLFDELLAELLLLALDRLELAVDALNYARPISALLLPELVAGLERLTTVASQDFRRTVLQAIETATGFQPQLQKNEQADAGSRVMQAVSSSAKVSYIHHSSEQVAADLLYFRLLNKQFEIRSPFFHGRRQRLLQLAQETNQRAGLPVDPLQLEAAVYVHDVGMMFLPESLWLKTGQLTEQERLQMQIHPILAGGMLERMPGWGGAAEMVNQHHEMPDGRGYPQRLRAPEICPGAKLLAIIDAFEAVMLKHQNRGTTGSTLRAIAEINACENQFAEEWILPFNHVVRRMLGSA